MREKILKNVIARICAVAVLCAGAALAADPGITVSAKQRYPWNGLVDLNFTIMGDAGTKYATSFTAKDMVGNTNIAMRTIRKADGTAASATEQLLPGTYNWVWDTAADLNVDNISYASFVSTNNAVLFRNRSLSAVSRYSVVFGGTSIPHIARGACIIKADGVGKALQFQHNDGTYLKCVCVHLEQSGNDITGYVKWARYMSGAYDIGTDFDGASYSTMRVAASNDESGYGVANLSLSYPNPQAGWRSDRVRVAGSANGFYSVKFNANGGSGTMANESFTYGTARVLMPNAFTRTGYTFQGWATSASGAKVYNDKQSVSNLTQTSGAVVNLYAVWKSALYMVVDLSSGSSSTSYPVSYLDAVPSGGWGNAYKTTKLVLRRIGAGTYKMQNASNVTLTKPFYIGVYEITQKQWSLLMGSNPAKNYGVEDVRPVYNISHNTIRGSSNGAKWPLSSAVDSSSFLGKLRSRTGHAFDLPTEAQWEYACRAGTTTTYSYGNSANENYMWYYANENSTYGSNFGAHPVGTKRANPWGLYDMHGNVWELCLDWSGTLAYGTDPKGPSSGSYRVKRGGAWNCEWDQCTSSKRGISTPLHYSPNLRHGKR